jgi:hypothetical protein
MSRYKKTNKKKPKKTNKKIPRKTNKQITKKVKFNGGTILGTDVDKTKFYDIKKGEKGILKTDGKIVCKKEDCDSQLCNKALKTFKLMQIFFSIGISPRPINLNIIDSEMEICMEFAGKDFDNRILKKDKYDFLDAINNLINILSTTSLIFIDLCLQFNPGNIVYNNSSKKVMLIDIDINMIRIGKHIPNDYWKKVLNIYKDYAMRDSDDTYNDDPYEIFNNRLKKVNDNYINKITLSQALSSTSIDIDDLIYVISKYNIDKLDSLFEGKEIKHPFEGRFNTLAYYNTMTRDIKN